MTLIKNALLKDYAYYGTGGTCEALYAPASVPELAESVRTVRRGNQPLCLLGGGTNTLVMDEPFHGSFILFRHFDTLRVDGGRVTVGGGIENTALAKAAHAAGLVGAAWMNRLPGQLGGTVRMNARCYGGEISQIVTKVTAVSTTGEPRTYTDKAMFRGYKDTIFMNNGDLITEVELQLVPGTPAQLAESERLMQHCERDREGKGQFAWPSCGCVFKNDYSVGVPSGMLLEAAGAKDLGGGGAEVSPYHANFVYNKGASSRTILELTLAMRERVYAVFGTWLAYEMEILGTVPVDLAVRIAEVRAPKVNEEALRGLKAKFGANVLARAP